MLEFFAIRNKEGRYFRRKGYGGYGATWVDGLLKARIYTRIGGARAVVSYFALNHPEYGVPEIVVLTATETAVIDETERVAKSVAKKEEKRMLSIFAARERALKDAEAALCRVKAEIERLQK